MSMKAISLLLLALCLVGCVQSEVPEFKKCGFPKYVAPCFIIWTAFVYNPANQTCQEVTFEGCYEGGETFETWPECQEKCVVNGCAHSWYGCCPDGVEYAEGENYKGCPVPDCGLSEFGCCRDQVTPATGRNFQGCLIGGCISTQYGCCPDQVNTAKGPNGLGCPKAVCRMPRSHGPCGAGLTRYAYNYKRGFCQQFLYGGCPGNDNNFLTWDKCDRVCAKLDYSCEYNGQKYRQGQSFTVDCNTCSCDQSVVTCTQEKCEDSCPKGWLRSGGFCYLYSYRRRTYEKAVEDCSEDGGSVVSPQTPEQNIQLKNFLARFRVQHFWVGLKANYQFNDGTNLYLWENWKHGYPNMPRCVRIVPKNGKLKWQAFPCDKKSSTVCQVPVNYSAQGAHGAILLTKN